MDDLDAILGSKEQLEEELLRVSTEEQQPAEPEVQQEEAKPEEEKPEEDLEQLRQKYRNLQAALREARERQQHYAGLVERLVSRLETAQPQPQPQEQYDEEDLEIINRVRKYVDPQLQTQQTALQQLLYQQQLQQLQQEYQAKRLILAQEHPDIQDAEMYASKVFVDFANNLYPDNAQARAQLLSQIQLMFYQHPDGPAAVLRAAKILGYNKKQQQQQEPAKAPITMSSIPGGKSPAQPRSLEERVKKLLDAPTDVLAKSRTEVDDILRELTEKELASR